MDNLSCKILIHRLMQNLIAHLHYFKYDVWCQDLSVDGGFRVLDSVENCIYMDH